MSHDQPASYADYALATAERPAILGRVLGLLRVPVWGLAAIRSFVTVDHVVG